MNEIKTIGVDLAKNIFHVVCCNAHGKVVRKKMLRRSQLISFFAQINPCLIGMEACSSAHYWARRLKELGHNVKLIAPQFVKAFLRGNKNDYNDALAISEALVKPEMRFVTIKSQHQQDIQALHRLRSLCIKERTALCNQIRGLLAEYGIIILVGIHNVRNEVPGILEDAGNGLSIFFRKMLSLRFEQMKEQDCYIQAYTQEMEALGHQNEQCKQLQSIPGFGPIVASAFYSEVGNGSQYKRGRDVSASIGLVPRQHSSGGKDILLGISKRGNGYLRSLLVHGARSVVSRAAEKDDKLSLWINKLVATRGKHKAIVALANKIARIGWAVLHTQTAYKAP